MEKKLGLKIGITTAVLGVGLYFFYTSDWYKSRYTGFFKKRIKVRDEDVLITTVPPTSAEETDLGGIYMYNADGSVIASYNNIGENMPFPLQKENGKYDNVAQLQAFLVFANPDNNLAVDGYYGVLTEAAAEAEVVGFVDEYGYGIYFADTDTSTGALDELATAEQYRTVTEQYFNEVVMGEQVGLPYFMNADCLELYDEATCA
tara:strand:+ start:29 stop:640 length:612 start_codon:yes stop_codon:yes gene_type:complete